MNKMIQSIREVLDQGEDVVMATVVDAPGRNSLAGARMLIRADGRTYGSIGGGMREAEVQRAAAGLFADRGPLIRILADPGEDGVASRIPCGSGTTVVIEHIASIPDNVNLFGELLEAHRKGLKCCLITPVSEGSAGEWPPARILSLSDENSRTSGLAGPVFEYPISEEKLSRIRLPVIEEFGARKFFLNPWSIPETVFIFGAGHIGQETAELTEKSGFRTIVLDDRAKYANRDRFSTADDVVVLDSFDDCFRGLAVTNDSYVIIATRGHRYEKALVKQALKTGAGYIGLIGSVRKRDALFAELAGEGFSIDDLLRVYCPTGISILAETPTEIAVSIVAQLVLLRARKKAANRREIRMTQAEGFLRDSRDREADGFFLARTIA
jgi:xanthine dehydrogenase accessory factor